MIADDKISVIWYIEIANNAFIIPDQGRLLLARDIFMATHG